MGRNRQFCVWAATFAALLVATSLSRAAGDDALRKKALQLNDITGKDAMNGKILELLKDKPTLKKLIDEAATMAKDKEQPFNFNGAYILAKAAYASKEFDNSLAFYKICADHAVKLKSGQKLVDVYDGLISLFMDNKKYDDAIRACQEFLEIKGGGQAVDKVKPLVMEQMILTLVRQKKTDDALKLTESLVKADEGGWYFVRLKGQVLREAGKFDESIGAFEETIDLLGKMKIDDDQEKAKEQEKLRDAYIERCRYMMSSVYTDMNQIDKAIAELRKLLKAHPESSTYNNDLGYVLADHDQELDDAEKMIRKAIEIDRDERQKAKEKGLIDADEDKENAAYLDSLGWVLYKRKNYAEAKKHLLESIKSDEGKHVEIFDHLADVHKALGENAEAAAMWKKALELESMSKRDENRKEAIKKKLAEVEVVKP